MSFNPYDKRTEKVIVGYARTSTSEQVAGFEAQERDLKAAGVEKVFKEQTSAVGPRPQLEQALDFVREGDMFVTTKGDRLARSLAELIRIVDRLEKKKVGLRILAMGVDTTTPTGRLMLNVIGSVAQFEREIMLERQREGIAKAKSAGLYKGRKPTAMAKAEDVRRLLDGGMPKARIARELGIGLASVYRILAAAA
jgi:DNA invertase Pin-like site-specific DNA recombinase